MAEAQNFDFEFEPEVEEDALSLCDLPLNDLNDDQESENTTKNTPFSPSESDPQDFFEFPVDPIYGYFPMDVVFCGKSIACSKPITNLTPELQIENPFFSRSESLRFSSPTATSPAGSASRRSPGSEISAATGSFRSHSLSSNSRKHKVLIGLVKYQPEMDLSELRTRQARRAPAPMFPVNKGGEQPGPIVASGRSGGKGHWGLIRSLRCRSHLLGALAKATVGWMPRV